MSSRLIIPFQQVTFTWRDYHQDNKLIITSMKGADFLKRFCLHILPPGFTRIRHYGFLSSAAKTKALAIVRAYFQLPAPEKIAWTWKQIAQTRMGINTSCCSKCGGIIHIARIIPDRFHHLARAPDCFVMS